MAKIKSSSKNNSEKVLSADDSEHSKNQSIKAIALIRAYRIRGHLIANLDPLGMMKRDYLHELHPADHGFQKEDYNRKIYVSSYLDKDYGTIKGNFNKAFFKQSIENFLENNYGIVKKELNKKHLYTGELKHKSHKDAVNYLLDKYISSYYGNKK